MSGLHSASRHLLAGPPVRLDSDQAAAVCRQCLETAVYRGWTLLAVAAMANHVHLVVGVEGDPEPSAILRDFKAYMARSLNRRWGMPQGGTWWTRSGSTRILPDARAVEAAVRYVREQEFPLAIWWSIDADAETHGGLTPPARLEAIDAVADAETHGGLTPPARLEAIDADSDADAETHGGLTPPARLEEGRRWT